MLCDSDKLELFFEELKKTIDELARSSWRSIKRRHQAIGRIELGALLIEIIEFEKEDLSKLSTLQKKLNENRKQLTQLIKDPDAQELFKKFDSQLSERIQSLSNLQNAA